LKHNSTYGFSLIEMLIVITLLSGTFLVFLQALNTGKQVRVISELKSTQSLLLFSQQNEIRSKRFDENSVEPYSTFLGPDSGETSLAHYDDLDDYNGYTTAFTMDTTFQCSVIVDYTLKETGFHDLSTSPTTFKRVIMEVTHPKLPTLADTIIFCSHVYHNH